MGARRRQIGDAVWLWALLAWYAAQTEEDWWVVAGSEGISDERIGVYLDVSAACAGRWRRRLERLGLIRTESVRPLNRRFWVRNTEKLEQGAMPVASLPVSKLVH